MSGKQAGEHKGGKENPEGISEGAIAGKSGFIGREKQQAGILFFTVQEVIFCVIGIKIVFIGCQQSKNGFFRVWGDIFLHIW